MLPHSYGRTRSSAQEWFERIVDYKQMDFETGIAQMKALASRNPTRVYTISYYRKQTKGQWARDDPAFVVLQALLLVVAALAYGIALHLRELGVFGMLALIWQTVFMDWLLFGAVVATIGWAIANFHMRQGAAVSERVEWLYAFDVHCNSFVPLFILVHVAQFLLLPLLNSESYVSAFMANFLYAVAFCAYFYMTHLGYRTLPFLKGTELYLYPVVAVVIIFLSSLVMLPFGVKLNATRACLAYHFRM